MKSNIGFTLAEVLITLVIIGIISAITIPTLISKYTEQEASSKISKAHQTLSQAYELAKIEYGTADNWNLIAQGSSEGAKNVADILLKYLSYQKYCGNQRGCLADQYKYLNGNNWLVPSNNSSHSSFVLNDGTFVRIYILSNNCSGNFGSDSLQKGCGEIVIDINGYKGPNILGKDFFYFYFTKDSVIPAGIAIDTRTPITSCSKNGTGLGCTGWVEYKANMDYLKNRTISW